MKSDLARIVYGIALISVGCALEELMPKFLGVGFPLLLAAVLSVSSRRGVFESVAFAVAAGAAEDAISSLPVATSASFFTIAALFANSTRSPTALPALAFPLYQMWLWMWLPQVGAGVFARTVVAAPLGCLAFVAVSALMRFAERRASIDA